MWWLNHGPVWSFEDINIVFLFSSTHKHARTTYIDPLDQTRNTKQTHIFSFKANHAHVIRKRQSFTVPYKPFSFTFDAIHT